jgi:hypothetical protein
MRSREPLNNLLCSASSARTVLVLQGSLRSNPHALPCTLRFQALHRAQSSFAGDGSTGVP